MLLSWGQNAHNETALPVVRNFRTAQILRPSPCGTDTSIRFDAASLNACTHIPIYGAALNCSEIPNGSKLDAMHLLMRLHVNQHRYNSRTPYEVRPELSSPSNPPKRCSNSRTRDGCDSPQSRWFWPSSGSNSRTPYGVRRGPTSQKCQQPVYNSRSL